MTATLIALPLRQTKSRPVNRVALTEQRVADLRATGATIYVNDSRKPGLSVRVTKAGTKSYVFTKKIRGKLFRVTLGKTAGMTLDAARKAAETYNGDLARGVDIAAVNRASKVAASAKSDDAR